MIARIESFKSIHFHRVGRAAQIMFAMAMEKANKELNLTEFKTPEEYMAMDDYTVWAALKKCELSKGIFSDLEKRRMLKCAYELTSTIRIQWFRTFLEARLIGNKCKGKLQKRRVFIDVPTVPSVPYHHAVLMETMEITLFSRSQIGKKTTYRISDISKIIENLKGFINILRVYTKAADREKVEQATSKILGKIPKTAQISY